MISNRNRICYTCGKAYDYCGHCSQYQHLPTWMTFVCSEECNDIFNACAQYNLGYYSKAEAKKILSKYDVNHKKFASNSINDTIKTIYTVTKRKGKASNMDTSVEDVPTLDVSSLSE